MTDDPITNGNARDRFGADAAWRFTDAAARAAARTGASSGRSGGVLLAVMSTPLLLMAWAVGSLAGALVRPARAGADRPRSDAVSPGAVAASSEA